MKKIVVTFILSTLCMILTTSCKAQSKLFTDAAKLPDVTSVYVSPAMMKLGGAMMAASNYNDYKKYIKKIKSMEVLTSDSSESKKKLNAMCDSIIAANKYELLIETTENNDRTMIYSQVPEDENTTMSNGLVIVNSDGSDLSVVYINGQIDVAEIVKEHAEQRANKN